MLHGIICRRILVKNRNISVRRGTNCDGVGLGDNRMSLNPIQYRKTGWVLQFCESVKYTIDLLNSLKCSTAKLE